MIYYIFMLIVKKNYFQYVRRSQKKVIYHLNSHSQITGHNLLDGSI